MTDVKKAVVELDEYEASNLRWLLNLVWGGHVPGTNTGDWVGQIPYKLDLAMIAAGMEYKPNWNAQEYFKYRTAYAPETPTQFPLPWENWEKQKVSVQEYAKRVRETWDPTPCPKCGAMVFPFEKHDPEKCKNLAHEKGADRL
jgi:hypothetical protein